MLYIATVFNLCRADWAVGDEILACLGIRFMQTRKARPMDFVCGIGVFHFAYSMRNDWALFLLFN